MIASASFGNVMGMQIARTDPMRLTVTHSWRNNTLAVHLNLNVLNQEFAFPKSGTATESETVPMERTKLTAVKRATKRIYSHVSIDYVCFFEPLSFSRSTCTLFILYKGSWILKTRAIPYFLGNFYRFYPLFFQQKERYPLFLHDICSFYLVFTWFW